MDSSKIVTSQQFFVTKWMQKIPCVGGRCSHGCLPLEICSIPYHFIKELNKFGWFYLCGGAISDFITISTKFHIPLTEALTIWSESMIVAKPVESDHLYPLIRHICFDNQSPSAYCAKVASDVLAIGHNVLWIDTEGSAICDGLIPNLSLIRTSDALELIATVRLLAFKGLEVDLLVIDSIGFAFRHFGSIEWRHKALGILFEATRMIAKRLVILVNHTTTRVISRQASDQDELDDDSSATTHELVPCFSETWMRRLHLYGAEFVHNFE